MRSVAIRLALLAALAPAAHAADIDPATLLPRPDTFTGAAIEKGTVALTAPDRWAALVTRDDADNAALSATVTIRTSAPVADFFGSSWNVWPDKSFNDQGFEAGLLLRTTASAGYRVQISHRYQEVALVKYPAGGYLRSVPVSVPLDKPFALSASVRGGFITVSLAGKEVVRYFDTAEPVAKGAFGVAASSRAKVTFADATLTALDPPPPTAPPAPHQPDFRVRKWLGGRAWVFDGDEPVLMLPTPEVSAINSVKLRPGVRPLLQFNGHWDIANQGAYPEGISTNSETKTAGGGASLTADWTARQKDGRFVTRTKLTAGWDAKRQAYTWDIAGELEVLPGKPFEFKYGYDFEHHTPLDPFNWQYIVVRGGDGKPIHRPVYPVDPGPTAGLYPAAGGYRVWHGRHNDAVPVCPAVEYDLPDPGKRKLNTAVCAAFYDTGVSFAAEKAEPGTVVKVKYRYTGWPADEAATLFRDSTVQKSHMLDPDHHYVFADEWPKLTFSKFEPMSKTWMYGRTPFMTAHNARPTYELARNTGVGSGFALKLGPDSFGKAALPVPAPLPKGRHVVTMKVKTDNAVGPGGRVEVTATDKAGKVLWQGTHFTGNGLVDWLTDAFGFDLPTDAAGLAVAFGNAGTGDVLFTDVEFRRPADGEVVAGPRAAPERKDASPDGALADYRFTEQKGRQTFDHAGGFGLLELANVGWTTDAGRHALRFADNTTGTADYPRGRMLDRSYFSHPSYADVRTVPAAIAGHHGGGRELKAMTAAAWVKPAASMGKSTHGGKGDIVGVGARAFVLRLVGQSAPYKLGASVAHQDYFEAPGEIAADKWVHVAMTAAPEEGKWRVKLFIDGKEASSALAAKAPLREQVPPSICLGTELFYLHDAYYRGLIGRTLVFGRALSADEIAGLAK